MLCKGAVVDLQSRAPRLLRGLRLCFWIRAPAKGLRVGEGDEGGGGVGGAGCLSTALWHPPSPEGDGTPV